MKISPTEPGTVLGFDKTNVFRPLYNIQFACDLDSVHPGLRCLHGGH
jgi:hypothetical protein